MEKIILFDFFGVISTEIAPFWFARHFDEEAAQRIKMEMVTPADIGDITENEMYQKISERLGISPEVIRQEWRELIRLDHELIAYIKELKRTHRVYLLSNAPAEFLNRILEENSLYELFDEVFISSEMRLIKPSAEFFTYCLDKIGARPEECIFTDDNINNVRAARSLGIEAIHFTCLEDYRRELLKRI